MASGNSTPLKQTSPSPDESDHEESVDPRDAMKSFDWQDLETKYLDAMEVCKAEEDVHLREFESLSRYFGLWAETISGHEQKRSHTRLKTQSALVVKQEVELEERRKHYVKVVEAFQNALNMLNNLSAPQYQPRA